MKYVLTTCCDTCGKPIEKTQVKLEWNKSSQKREFLAGMLGDIIRAVFTRYQRSTCMCDKCVKKRDRKK